MFGKSNWVVRGIPNPTEQFASLAERLQEVETRIDVLLENTIDHPEELVLGLSLPAFPLGNVMPNLLENFYLGGDLGNTGTYGFWAHRAEVAPSVDPNLLREALAYENYNRPFKLLDKEQKEDIDSLVLEQPSSIKREAHPIILDFLRGLVWINSSSKKFIEDILAMLDERLGLTTNGKALSFDTDGWVRKTLTRLAEGELFRDEFDARACQVRNTRDPKAVTPHEDPKIEKLLKKFFRAAEIDGYHAFLSAPGKVLLCNELSAVGVATPWDAVDTLNVGSALGIASAKLTVKEGSNGFDVFSIDLSDTTVDGNLLLKGLDPAGLRHELSDVMLEKGSATTINDLWFTAYQCHLTKTFVFINFVKDTLDAPHGMMVDTTL